MIKLSVFENEGNVSQDANFRAHLDNNWNAGNREFNNIWIEIGKYNTLFQRIDNLEKRMNELEKRCENIEKTHHQDIEEITDKHKEDIETVQEQLDRLNQAVFGYGEYEVNYETPHHDSSVTEINTDSNPMLKN